MLWYFDSFFKSMITHHFAYGNHSPLPKAVRPFTHRHISQIESRVSNDYEKLRTGEHAYHVDLEDFVKPPTEIIEVPNPRRR